VENLGFKKSKYLFINKYIMKQFIISEEERSRILNMHGNATKRNYLNERVMDPTDDCDRYYGEMEYIFSDYEKIIENNLDLNKKERLKLYDEFESEIGGILDEVYENNCPNYEKYEELYDEYLYEMVEILEIDNL
jgi:hypothetical protein